MPNLALDLFVLHETGQPHAERPNQPRLSPRAVPHIWRPLSAGFMSYCLGVGLALVWFGSYLRFRTRSAAVLGPLLLVWGFTTLLCHLAS